MALLVGLLAASLWSVTPVRATQGGGLGRTIHVMKAADGQGGACPGSTCNLRAAWSMAQVNDTIVLDVDPIMSLGRLGQPSWANATTNGTVTLTGTNRTTAVIHGGSGLISIDHYPYSQTRFVTLAFQYIKFSGFHATGIHPGYIVCLSSDPAGEFCAKPQQESIMDRAVGETDGRSTAELLGGDDTRFGNWSDLRARPVLRIESCVFENNSRQNNVSIFGSLIFTNADGATLPVLIQSTQFLNNHVSGVNVIGMIISNSVGSLSYSSPLMISDSKFIGNMQDTFAIKHSSLYDCFQGPLLGAIAPISISGSSFEANSVGPSRAVVASDISPKAPPYYHVYVYNSNFLGNVANSQSDAKKRVGTIMGGWIVLANTTINIPPTTTPKATWSWNDQYFLESSIASDANKDIHATGYQIYNRNPGRLSFDNTTDPHPGQGYGWADCVEAKPWLPCPKGKNCVNVHNPRTSKLVGYKCE